MDDDERRRSQRTSYVAFAWYGLITDDEEPLQEGIARSIDLSLDGLGMVTPRPLALGRKVFVKIKAPEGTIAAVAVVVNVADHGEGTYRVGLRFEILAPSDLPVLHRMVAG